MRSSPKLRPCWWDGLIVLAVIALAAGCAAAVWVPAGQEQLTAVISVDGETLEQIPLEGLSETEKTIRANGYTLRVVLTAAEVWVEEADCPTQDCVHTGHISKSGQSIVCLPARVIVQLQGGADDGTGVDAVIG
ncbi:NusG domain II-containing protein [Dysosmobacter sp.]